MTEPYRSTLHTAEDMRAYRTTPLTHRLHPATVRAAWWTWRSLRSVAARLPVDGVRATVPAPPAVPAGARRGVDAVLRRTEPTCLERSLVYQAWLAAQGVPCEVVVGVATGAEGFKAHAWLDVEQVDPGSRGYREIHRLPPEPR